MHDGKGNRYEYKPSYYGFIIYKNNEFYMQVATEEDAKDIIIELCEDEERIQERR